MIYLFNHFSLLIFNLFIWLPKNSKWKETLPDQFLVFEFKLKILQNNIGIWFWSLALFACHWSRRLLRSLSPTSKLWLSLSTFSQCNWLAGGCLFGSERLWIINLVFLVFWGISLCWIKLWIKRYRFQNKIRTVYFQ